MDYGNEPMQAVTFGGSMLASPTAAALSVEPRRPLHPDDQRGVQAELEALHARGLAAVDVSPGR
jgi:hypothetical protein